MAKDQALAVFENYRIRRVYDAASERGWFSVVDIVAALTQQPDFQTARKYWNKLKARLNKEGSQTVTNCRQLKMVAEDGKQSLTDVADPEKRLRIIQSVPSPKAEPKFHANTSNDSPAPGGRGLGGGGYLPLAGIA